MRTTVFVFGSNLKGIHGAGAARAAVIRYGAKYGVGIGRTGNAYAIPTKIAPTWDKRQLPLETIQKHVTDFIRYAKEHPELDFIVTRIGCGLAGYTDNEIAPMFKEASSNVKLPSEWNTGS